MKRLTLFIVAIVAYSLTFGQVKPDKLIFKQYQSGFYQNVIMKDANAIDAQQEPSNLETYPEMDMTGMDLPNKINLYKSVWHNPPISQGNAGTCWCYSTVSFFESEIYRQQNLKVKLSETYIIYWEYIEKATEFVRTRGNSLFDEGSEADANTRIVKKYGMMPYSVYSGLIDGRKYPSHAKMMEEMKNFLNSVKANNMWNDHFVISTIKSILNKYLGEPPTKFTVDGKDFTPLSYMTDYLKFNPDDYVSILSVKEQPYWKQVEYTVPDNWKHTSDYYNVPLDVFTQAIDNAIRNGYSVAIGGDVSEAGFSRTTQCALIPSFDIPAQFINEDSREFRFANQTTTDDHGMHLVGYVDYKGQKWYLVKDSSSGSRNNDQTAPEFGYYFFRADYIALKIMDFMINKNAIQDVLKKF